MALPATFTLQLLWYKLQLTTNVNTEFQYMYLRTLGCIAGVALWTIEMCVQAYNWVTTA